jgi:hypothetical protein
MARSANKYILLTWYWDTSSDYERHHSFETEFEFVTGEQLDDIKQLMTDHRIKQWVTDPETITAKNWKEGDGAIIEFRNVTIKPVKIVETWSYQPETTN